MREIVSPLDGFGSPFGTRSRPQIITAIIRPALAPIVSGDTVEDALSADVDQTSNYASTAGTIATVQVDILVNGETPAALDIPLDAGDTIALSVTVTDSEANVRVFSAARVVGAVVPDAFDVADWGISVGSALDPDAAAYIAAVETADTQALEPAVQDAINDFVVGCKTDGIWDAIKASCIMAGARTLAGALVPLKGTAPTNFNFVSADYDRKTGLKGDGSTKYLSSNRSGNADPQNSFHSAVFVHTAPTSGTGGAPNAFPVFVGNITGLTTGARIAFRNSGNGVLNFRNTSADADSGPAGSGSAVGLFGNSRDNASNYAVRISGANTTYTRASQTPDSSTLGVYRTIAGASAGQTFSNGRYQFYSIGEAVDLAALDTRTTALMTAIEETLP
jgi:uncharacterized glyoxalase superfamily protein PhnB